MGSERVLRQMFSIFFDCMIFEILLSLQLVMTLGFLETYVTLFTFSKSGFRKDFFSYAVPYLLAKINLIRHTCC